MNRLSELLRRGDTLVVGGWIRLGRSLKDLIEWVNRLEQWGLGLRSLQESIDTQIQQRQADLSHLRRPGGV
jgi:DNA invertase Pin-like site-specific DNA recombinase